MTDDREPPKQVDESEFMDIAQNDPVRARNLRLTLEKLAESGSNETVKEMAREVLSGRLGLREAVAIPAYSEGLVESMQPFKEKWAQLSDTEREELAAEGQRLAEEQERELREERDETQRNHRSSGGTSRHSGGWSLY
jgi:hypothetical protein